MNMSMTKHAWRFLRNPEPFLKTENTKPSWRRQFHTAATILDRFAQDRFGQLLADDTGLGKTRVAALVAMVYARRNPVLILVPSKRLIPKWVDDLSMVQALCGTTDGITKIRTRWNRLTKKIQKVKPGKEAGTIAVITHSDFAKGGKGHSQLTATLLIIDEAHRSKNRDSDFRKQLRSRIDKFERVLFLTATPFSIGIDELIDTMKLVSTDGDGSTWTALREFNEICNEGDKADKDDLAGKRKNAIAALEPWVIRHTVEGLPNELSECGEVVASDLALPEIVVPEAHTNEKEVLARVDRLLNLLSRKEMLKGARGGDPRFAVGWRYLRSALKRDDLKTACESDPITQYHHKWLKAHCPGKGVEHPKMAAVADAVAKAVEEHHEKIVVFCSHHTTRDELVDALRFRLPEPSHDKDKNREQSKLWKSALRELFPENPGLVKWASNSCVRNQMARWIGDEWPQLATKDVIVAAITGATIRPKVCAKQKPPTIKEALEEVAKQMARSLRPRDKVLVRYEHNDAVDRGGKPYIGTIRQIYGNTMHVDYTDANDTEVPIEFAALPDGPKEKHHLGTWTSRVTKLETDKGEDDAQLRLFNTQFGPDVLVATNKLSEGIDLHRACRILVHYEMDPSPVRVKQREGRVRRIHGWAHKTGLPVVISTPRFPGTRDAVLVDIISARLRKFGWLLGGVRDVTLDELDKGIQRSTKQSLEEANDEGSADPLGVWRTEAVVAACS